MAKIGRPTRLNDEITEALCKAIRGGMYMYVACDHVGLPLSTFKSWMKRGAEEPGGAYATFMTAVKKAESDAEMKALDVISDCMFKGNWTAAAWYLERRHPERWGRHGRDAREASQEPQEDVQNAEQVRSDVLARISRLMASEEPSA